MSNVLDCVASIIDVIEHFKLTAKEVEYMIRMLDVLNRRKQLSAIEFMTIRDEIGSTVITKKFDVSKFHESRDRDVSKEVSTVTQICTGFEGRKK